jgi:hypothetical protein
MLCIATTHYHLQIDGMEFESSSVALDLRFVPDNMQFDTVTVRDSATAISSTYTPPTFIFKALQQTKVCVLLIVYIYVYIYICTKYIMCCCIMHASIQ